MLLSLECEKFPDSHRVITFLPGLNSVIGVGAGGHATGKSTFLRMIDFVFGGSCYLKEPEILREIGHHELYFSFRFGDNAPLYYCRKTSDPDNVICCDKSRHVIETITVSKFQRTLMENYAVNRIGVSLNDISEHFFRIYRRMNVLEQYPLSTKPSEMPETTVNFIIRLFRHADILNQIQSLARELHVDVSKVRSQAQEEWISLEEIDNLQATINSLRKRLQDTMEKNEAAQAQLFGYSPRAMEQANKIRNDLTKLAEQHSRLTAQLTGIQKSMEIQSFDSKEDIEDLQTFFPGVSMLKIEAIDGFHNKIREILLGELGKEEDRLKKLLNRCDREIKRLQTSLEESGTARKMSSQLVSECASLMNTISNYENQLSELVEERNRQQERAAAKKQIRDLLDQEREIMKSIEEELNTTMGRINSFLVGESERSPSIHLTSDKAFSFGISGNSSEVAAFRSMVIYDLSILELCGIPTLIHDSNILKRIEDSQLERLLTYYEKCGHQIFVAYDHLSAATEKANNKLVQSAVLKLSDEDLLFGRPWSKKKTGGKA